VIYAAIGRFVVRYAWRRYATEIKLGAGATLLALVVGGYLAAGRDAAEG
jgi:hypothetical protein